MVDYGSIWSTADIFCQRCHKQKPGVSLKSMIMSKANISLDLCTSCLSDIASQAGN